MDILQGLLRLVNDGLEDNEARNRQLHILRKAFQRSREDLPPEVTEDFLELKQTIYCMRERRTTIQVLEKRLRQLNPSGQCRECSRMVRELAYQKAKDELEGWIKMHRKDMKRDQEFTKAIVNSIGFDLSRM